MKAKVAASMKQKLYNVHVHLIQQNEELLLQIAAANQGKVDAVSM